MSQWIRNNALAIKDTPVQERKHTLIERRKKAERFDRGTQRLKELQQAKTKIIGQGVSSSFPTTSPSGSGRVLLVPSPYLEPRNFGAKPP